MTDYIQVQYTYRFRSTHFTTCQPWNCAIHTQSYNKRPLSLQEHTHGIHQVDPLLIAQMREVLSRDTDTLVD